MTQDRHALIRTSPKGGPFIGRCMRCGKDGLTLTMMDAEDCPNPGGDTDEKSFLDAIRGETP